MAITLAAKNFKTGLLAIRTTTFYILPILLLFLGQIPHESLQLYGLTERAHNGVEQFGSDPYEPDDMMGQP